MDEIENKSEEQVSRRRFLEFTGKSMVVTGLGVVVALSSKAFLPTAKACCEACETACQTTCDVCEDCLGGCLSICHDECHAIDPSTPSMS